MNNTTKPLTKINVRINDVPLSNSAIVPSQPSYNPSPSSNALSIQDQQKITQLVNKLKSTKDVDIGSFGADVQQNVAKISDQILDHAKGADFDSIGVKLSDILTKVKNVNATPNSIPVIGKLIDGFVNNKHRLQARFTTANEQIEQLVNEVHSNCKKIQQRLQIQNNLYDANQEQWKQLQLHIEAAKTVLSEKNQEVVLLEADAQLDFDVIKVQHLSNLKQDISNLERMLSNLERISMSVMQAAPQIRMMQANGTLMLDHFRTVLTQVVPTWKRQFAMAIMVDEQQKSAHMATVLTDMTNDMQRDLATKLHQNSVSIAKTNQRGVIDLETLEHVQQELISSINDVLQINAEGAAQRAHVSTRIAEMQHQLLTINRK